MKKFCIILENGVETGPGKIDFTFCYLEGEAAFPVSFTDYFGGLEQLLADLQGLEAAGLPTFYAGLVQRNPFGFPLRFNNLSECDPLFRP